MIKFEIYWEITKFGLDDQEFEETGYSRIPMNSFKVQAEDKDAAVREAEKIIRIETEKELKARGIKNKKPEKKYNEYYHGRVLSVEQLSTHRML